MPNKETSSLLFANLRGRNAERLSDSSNATIMAFLDAFEIMVKRELTTDEGLVVVRALQDSLIYAHRKGRVDAHEKGYVKLSDHFLVLDRGEKSSIL